MICLPTGVIKPDEVLHVLSASLLFEDDLDKLSYTIIRFMIVLETATLLAG